MIKFCRNCGKELKLSPEKTCMNCGTNAVKASAFCRYCGHSTTAKDAVCPTCGAAIKPLPASVKTLHQENPKLVKLGRTLNLSIVVILLALYIIFAIPKAVTKSIKAATGELVQSSTGYTAIPLESISVFPPIVPPLGNWGEGYALIGITVNTTQQLTVYAVFKNVNTDNATAATHLEDVTANSTYRSSDSAIASVNPAGLVKAVSPGTVNITVSYTAAPGSANFSAAALAEGKKPATFSVLVPVTVR